MRRLNFSVFLSKPFFLKTFARLNRFEEKLDITVEAGYRKNDIFQYV